MVAVSVGESESLKMQDPFKQYVKLSRLKIYVTCVSMRAKASPSFLSAQQRGRPICGVETRVSTCTKQSAAAHTSMQLARTRKNKTKNGGDVSEIGFLLW